MPRRAVTVRSVGIVGESPSALDGPTYPRIWRNAFSIALDITMTPRDLSLGSPPSLARREITLVIGLATAITGTFSQATHTRDSFYRSYLL